MLNKHLPKKSPETNNSIENGLIGVVVWRRAHISNTISPNSSSHHKHGLKKQPFAPPKRAHDSSNVNANTPTRGSPHVLNKPQPQNEEDDDIPPGFGPGAAVRDDDDLPEFNFSGDMSPSMARIESHNLHRGVKATQRPVDQVRELIKKYGQSSTPSRGVVDWNDDDDDDIPEWRPQVPQISNPQPFLVAQGHRLPPVHLHATNQHVAPVLVTQQPLPPGGLGQQPPPGGRWVQPPPGPLHGARWRQ